MGPLPSWMLQWEPKLAGYMQFMAESKVVYDTFEELLADGSHNYCEWGHNWVGPGSCLGV